MYRFLQVFCSLFSALILALAIPNETFTLGSPLLGLFALVPFYIAINNSKSYKEAFCLSFLHGIVVHILSSFWLGNFQGFATFTLGASAIGTGFVEAFMSLFFYFPILMTTKLKDEGKIFELDKAFLSIKIPFRTIWFASAYTVWEWVKSSGFLGYPWGTVSMTAYTLKYITQIADITGAYGVTFLFAFFSATIGEGVFLLKSSTSKLPLKNSSSYIGTFKASVALIAISLVYGFYEYEKPRTEIKTLNAILVQQNGDPWKKGAANSIKVSQRLTQEKLNEFSDDYETCDIVVWSEAVLTKRFPNAKNYYSTFPEEEPLIPFIKKMNTPFIIGGAVVMNQQNHQFGNSTLLFGKDGELQGSYQKMHLVPFAELIPGVENEKVRQLMKRMVGFSYGWYPGKTVTLFEIPLSTKVKDTRLSKTISIINGTKKETPERPQNTLKFATPICFDDTATEVCRAMFLCGSEMFLNVTNDAWSQTNSAEIQHAVVAHYRAIEFRTTLARCTNAGYTVVFGPNGEDLMNLPLFEEDALAAQIPIYERQMTIYAKLGNWLPKTLALLLALFIIKEAVVEYKKYSEKDNEVLENEMSVLW